MMMMMMMMMMMTQVLINRKFQRKNVNIFLPISFNIWTSAWDLQQNGMCDQQSLRSACAYAQSDQSLCLLLEYSMIVKLLSEHNLEFLSLKGVRVYTCQNATLLEISCTGSYVLGCSKEPSHWDGSFEYPQHMFWLRNKTIKFSLYTLK